MALEEPTVVSLAKMIEDHDKRILAAKNNILSYEKALHRERSDLSSLERARGVTIAQLAMMIGIIKPRENRAGSRVPTVSPLTEEELQQADIAVNGAVKEISEEVNRSGRE